MTQGSFKCYPHVYFLTQGVISCLLGTNVVVVLPPVYTRNNFKPLFKHTHSLMFVILWLPKDSKVGAVHIRFYYQGCYSWIFFPLIDLFMTYNIGPWGIFYQIKIVLQLDISIVKIRN